MLIDIENHDLGDSMKVNGTVFEIIHTIYDSETGLDALTVQNVETAELTIVYVGSEQPKEDWIDTNLRLPGRIPPPQLEAANDYFDYVKDTFGPVNSITGNSLGGANVNAVAIENPDVRAVTLNPASLPSGMIDPNYHGKYHIRKNLTK